MTKSIRLCQIGIGLFFLTLVFQSCLSGQKIIYARVIGIKDGDTIEVLTADKKTVTVRLNGIDAPEKDQAYSQKSRENLSRLIYRKQVRVYTYGRDRYGRLIADIYLGSENVNYIQVSDGFAWHYWKYSNDQYLAQLEKQARERKLGLWQERHPTPPWEFRKKR
jgi:endonuclease YncB( thermonuclease family)